jgi:lysozyme
VTPRQRQAVTALTVSAAAVLATLGSEGFRSAPYIPTQGDVPTIGYGSTVYEDGTRVTLADPPISKERALQIVRDHKSKDEALFRASLPGVKLTQGEYDLYMDFTYQYGITNWRSSSMRRHLLNGEYLQACNALPAWRKQAGRDCSLPQNWGPKGCKGVWTRQLERQAKCLAEQG